MNQLLGPSCPLGALGWELAGATVVFCFFSWLSCLHWEGPGGVWIPAFWPVYVLRSFLWDESCWCSWKKNWIPPWSCRPRWMKTCKLMRWWLGGFRQMNFKRQWLLKKKSCYSSWKLFLPGSEEMPKLRSAKHSNCKAPFVLWPFLQPELQDDLEKEFLSRVCWL